MPTLYTHPLSTYAQRVHIALLEKGVSWETEVVDMGKKQHRSPEYLAINPYGRVPALVDGPLKLVESSAILDYLEAKHPSPALLPDSAEGRAQVHMHVKLCDLQFAGHVGTVIFPKRFLPEARWQPELMAQASKHIAKHLAILDAQLAQDEWLVVPAVGAGGRPYPLEPFAAHLVPEPSFLLGAVWGCFGVVLAARVAAGRRRARSR